MNKLSLATPEEKRSLGRRRDGCDGNTETIPAEVDF
jgi:hypothetical protein